MSAILPVLTFSSFLRKGQPSMQKSFRLIWNPESMAVITFATLTPPRARAPYQKATQKDLFHHGYCLQKAKFINRKGRTGTRLLFDKLYRPQAFPPLISSDTIITRRPPPCRQLPSLRTELMLESAPLISLKSPT